MEQFLNLELYEQLPELADAEPEEVLGFVAELGGHILPGPKPLPAPAVRL